MDSSSLQLQLATWETMVFFATMIGDFASQLLCGYPADNTLMRGQHKRSTDRAQTFCGQSMDVPRTQHERSVAHGNSLESTIHNRIPYLTLFLFLIIEGIILVISVNTKRCSTSAKFRMESANCSAQNPLIVRVDIRGLLCGYLWITHMVCCRKTEVFCVMYHIKGFRG